MRLSSAAALGVLVFALEACKGSKATTAASAAFDAEPEASASSASEIPSGALSASPSASAADASTAPVVHHRGIAGMFFRAAQETNLTDDQKIAVDKLEEPIRSDPGPRREMAAFHADLAASIKAGRIDTSKIQADEAAVAKAYGARQDAQASALNSLHEALDADQRSAVVEALRTSQAAHDRPAAILVSDAGAPEWAARRLARMKTQLVLDLDQQKEVAAVLARNEPPSPAAVQARFEADKKQMAALLDAFAKDSFDAKKLDLSAQSSSGSKKPTEPLERQVKYIGQLLPILTAGQRERLANLMERPRERGRGDSIAEPFDVGLTSSPR